jgi:hypothetical protein
MSLLATFALVAASAVPSGVYSMPEMCRELKAASGEAHFADPAFIDYPVFVSTKSGDPDRVRKLVASAFRAEWQKDDSGYRLRPAKQDGAPDLAEFERQYRAAAGSSALKELPIETIYQMPIGSNMRFGYPSNALVKPLPASLLRDARLRGHGLLILRRMAEGIFESRIELGGKDDGAFSDAGNIVFSSIPPAVSEVLKPMANRGLLSPEETGALLARVRSPIGTIGFSDLAKNDPIGQYAAPLLPALGKKLDIDAAVILPDLSVFSLGNGPSQSFTVQSVVEGFCPVVDWTLADGALIGRMPSCERFGAAQSKREVLQKLLATLKNKGTLDAASLGSYVAAQRKTASDSWSDVMLLGLSGQVIDMTYLGDHPHNLRLYAALTKSDWKLIDLAQPFAMSALSPMASKAIVQVLLQSRSRLIPDKERPTALDPAFWPSLDPRFITIQAALKEEPVLIGWTESLPEVHTAGESGTSYEFKRKRLGSEPLYRPATRRKLAITITSPGAGASIETGFVEVEGDDHPPVTYDKLPEPFLSQFKDALARTRERGVIGQPPP